MGLFLAASNRSDFSGIFSHVNITDRLLNPRDFSTSYKVTISNFLTGRKGFVSLRVDDEALRPHEAVDVISADLHRVMDIAYLEELVDD